MATSDILGLFATPEQYQAQQMASERQQAGLLAGLTPAQLANYGAAIGGQQLGRGLGSLFGAQDPQLQMITRRQQLLSQINPGDPQALLRAAQQAGEMGDPQMALQLTDFANRQASEIAQQQQRMAAARREQQQAVPADIAKARELGILTTALNELERTPVGTPGREQQMTMLRTQISALERPEKATPDMSNAAALADLTNTDRNSDAWKQEYKSQLTRLTTKPENEKKSAFAQQLEDAGYIPGSPAYVSMMDKFLTKELTAKQEKEMSFGVDREATAMSEFGKRFSELTQDQQKKVNKMVDEERGKVSEKGAAKLVLPGQGKEGLKGVSSFRNEVIQTVKPFRDTVTATDNALTNIDDAIKTNNFISFNAARVQLAKALGDSTLSRRDIEQAGGDPSLIGGFFDATSTLFTGTPTKDTQKKIQSTLKAIRKVARNKANNELDRQRKLGVRAGYSSEDVDLALDFPEFKGAPTPPAPANAPASNRKAVPFNSLPTGNQ
jgi:hypothetical protein